MSGKTDSKKQVRVPPEVDSVLFVDNNSIRYWVVLAICFFVGYSVYGSLLVFIGLSIVASLVIDALYYLWNIKYYCPSLAIARGYSVSAFINDTLHSQGIDYGFNFYDGDYAKSPATAQIDKFKFAIKQLGIREGDRVIDIGCGCGDWLHYLQTEMKCKVVGINITRAQAVECHKRGLTCHVTDWKLVKSRPDLRRELYGSFDVVTCWDTVEHYVSMGEGLMRRHNRNKVYQDLFRLVRELYDPESRLKKCWISCLHMRRPMWTGLLHLNLAKFRKAWYVYLLDKFHSGFYPSYYKDTDGVFYDGLGDNAKRVGLDVEWRKDVTLDYYMTSVLNETHFGRHRFKLTTERAVVLSLVSILDPYWFHRVLWYFQESWMLQFNPKDIGDSDVLLWWLTFGESKQAEKK